MAVNCFGCLKAINDLDIFNAKFFSGPGIPEAELPRLFKRFSRLEPAGSTVSGAGLGLYFVRIVAEKHGGQVKADSGPDGGARFCVSLPRIN